MHWMIRCSPRSGSSRESPPGRWRRATGRLRLTPTAKAIITGVRDACENRRAGLGIVLNGLLGLLGLLGLSRPDPAAELLAALGVDALTTRERFAEYDQEGQP